VTNGQVISCIILFITKCYSRNSHSNLEIIFGNVLLIVCLEKETKAGTIKLFYLSRWLPSQNIVTCPLWEYGFPILL
jgi:hypothetical protein